MTNEIDELLRARVEITKGIATQQELVVQSKEAAKRAQGKEAVALAKTIVGAMYTVEQFVKLLDQYDAQIASHYDSLASRFIQELDEQTGYLLEIEGYVKQGILPQEALDNQQALLNSLGERLQSDPDLATSVAKRRNITAYLESEVLVGPEEAVPPIPAPDVEILDIEELPLEDEHVDEHVEQFLIGEPHESEDAVPPQHPTIHTEVFPGYDVAEFGPLSRRDIAVLAAAISAHWDLLNSLVSDHGLRLLDQETLKRLIRICGDQPVLDDRTVVGQDRSEAIENLRSKALEQIQSFIESDQLPIILDQIDQKGNFDVWALLFNLDEMRNVIKQTEEGTLRGVDLLGRVLTEEKMRTDLRAASARQKPIALRVAVAPVRVDPLTESLATELDDQALTAHIVLESSPIVEAADEASPEIKDENQEGAADEIGLGLNDKVDATPIKEKSTHKENKRIQAAKIALHAILVDVLSKDVLSTVDGSNKNTINGCYRGIKASFIEELEESHLLGPRKFVNNRQMYDQAQVAAIVYFYRHQHDPSMTPKLKKEIYALAAEQLSGINALIEMYATTKSGKQQGKRDVRR